MLFVDKYTGTPSSCCPDKYLHLCCPKITKPCNKNATIQAPKPPNVRVSAFHKPPCMHPWDSTSCQAGFYADPITMKTIPCPNGKKKYCKIK